MKSRVLLGNDTLRRMSSELKDLRIGLVGNHTSLFFDDSHLASFLELNSKKLTLFGPEHSFKGTVEDQKHVENVKDDEGTKIYSLFGEFETPTRRMCSEVDLFIFDIQSVGVRFYTYICTLYNVMVACKRYNKELIVCDRPNPISCLEETISGPLTRPSHCSFFSPIPLPLRHSLTIGELAMMFNKESIGSYPALNIRLKVLKMSNYQRSFFHPSTGLKFPSCSPCMPNISTALLYPGFCLFEGTNVAEGRGTEKPFLNIGAPWMKRPNLVTEIFPHEERNSFIDYLRGVEVKNTKFTPISMDSCTKPKYMNEECYGLELSVNTIDFSIIRPVKLVLWIMCKFRILFGTRFKVRKFMDRLYGSELIRSTLNDTEDVGDDVFRSLVKNCDYGITEFKKTRKKYLLYQ